MIPTMKKEETNMKTEICSAINSKQVLEFYYNGGIRLVEPFCYGIHKNTNNELLRGYQACGYSESGESNGWKLFLVDDISKLTITNNHFSGSREYYNPDDKAMTTIYCHV